MPLLILCSVLGLVMTAVEAIAYVMSGMYGPVSEIGVGNATLVILQLFFAGILVLLWVCFHPLM